MKGKKRLIALLLSFLMVLSQMSVATFALDTVADENSDQTVEEQAVEETQPEADVKTAASETEPAATEPAAAETATEPEAAQPAAVEPAKAEPAKAEEKKAEPAKAEEKKAEVKEEAFDQSQTVDGVTVNVSAAKGVFPAGSKLSVSKVAVPDAVDTSDAEAAYAFDISILANGEKIQPDGKATVSFTTEEVAQYDTAVYHMDGGAQKMSVSENGETATVKTSGFSVYVVAFKTIVWTNREVGNNSVTMGADETKGVAAILSSCNVSSPGISAVSSVSLEEGEGVVSLVDDTSDATGKAIKVVGTGEAVLYVQRAGTWGNLKIRIVVSENAGTGYNVRFATYILANSHEDVGSTSATLKEGETKGVAAILKECGVSDGGIDKVTDVSLGEGTEAVSLVTDTSDKTGKAIKGIKSGKATLHVTRPVQWSNLEVQITVEKKYEVSFDPGEAGTAAKGMPESPQYVDPNGTATKPTDDPTWEGHVFVGWYKDGATTPFDFNNTQITEDTVLVAHWTHPWTFERNDNNFEGKVFCEATDCPYHSGFEIAIDAYDVYHRDKVEVTVDGPTPKEGYPDDKYKIGEIQYYEGEITTDAGFEGKTPVSFDKVNSTEGDYTARVIIGTDSTDNKPSIDCLFKSFQVVSAGPIAAEGLVYKDGRCVVADDDMRPEGTSAIALYKHPTTGKYVRREKLLNDGSIPIGETKIDYIVLPNDDYDPENPEKYQIGYGDVTIDIAGRMFTISYDLNGGKLNGQTGVVTTKVEEGTVITLPSPTRSGYKFDYWEGSRYNAGDKYTVTADHTFKAVWKTSGSGKKGNGVNTGDTNDIAGLLALMIASVGALGAIGYRRRKEDQ